MDRLVGGTADGRALRRLSQPAQPAGLPAQHRPPDWMDLQRGLPAARRDRAAGDALCRVGGQALDPGGGPAARQRQVHRRHHSQDVPQGSAGLSGGLPRRKLWFSAAGRIAFQRRADHQRVSHPAPLRSPDQPALPAEAIRPGDPRHGRGPKEASPRAARHPGSSHLAHRFAEDAPGRARHGRRCSFPRSDQRGRASVAVRRSRGVRLSGAGGRLRHGRDRIDGQGRAGGGVEPGRPDGHGGHGDRAPRRTARRKRLRRRNHPAARQPGRQPGHWRGPVCMGAARRLGAARRWPRGSRAGRCPSARAGRTGSSNRLKLRLPRILASEDEDEEEDRPSAAISGAGQEEHPQPSPLPWGWMGLIIAAALVTRLGYLFFFADPQNAGDGFTDAYHHWQIAYLTKEVGLSHGPRLWDMRGWEYFWGPVHPLLMSLLFFATGSTSIVLARLLSLAFGTFGVALIFLLCRRYWGLGVAVFAGAFAALSPVAIFNDTAGMAEPIAIALLLFGIWLLPCWGFWEIGRAHV